MKIVVTEGYQNKRKENMRYQSDIMLVDLIKKKKKEN